MTKARVFFTCDEVAREVSLDGGGGRRREGGGVGDDEGAGLVVEGGFSQWGIVERRRRRRLQGCSFLRHRWGSLVAYRRWSMRCRLQSFSSRVWRAKGRGGLLRQWRVQFEAGGQAGLEVGLRLPLRPKVTTRPCVNEKRAIHSRRVFASPFLFCKSRRITTTFCFLGVLGFVPATWSREPSPSFLFPAASALMVMETGDPGKLLRGHSLSRVPPASPFPRLRPQVRFPAPVPAWSYDSCSVYSSAAAVSFLLRPLV